jgi:hypothetical protein
MQHGIHVADYFVKMEFLRALDLFAAKGQKLARQSRRPVRRFGDFPHLPPHI